MRRAARGFLGGAAGRPSLRETCLGEQKENVHERQQDRAQAVTSSKRELARQQQRTLKRVVLGPLPLSVGLTLGTRLAKKCCHRCSRVWGRVQVRGDGAAERCVSPVLFLRAHAQGNDGGGADGSFLEALVSSARP